MIFVDLATEFANASFWGQLRFLSTVFTLVGGISALAAWISRRRVMGERDLAHIREKNLREQVFVEQKHLESSKKRVDALSDRLSLESFVELLVISELTTDELNASNVGGTLDQKVTKMDDGFNDRLDVLREVCIRLSSLWIMQIREDVPVATSKAEYYAKLAQALIDDDDARKNLDLVKESVAALAFDQGRYNTASPEWRSFDLAPRESDNKTLIFLLEQVNLRILEATKLGKKRLALRMAARLSFLMGYLPPLGIGYLYLWASIFLVSIRDLISLTQFWKTQTVC